VLVQLQTNGAARGSIAQQIARMDTGRLRAYRENLEFYQDGSGPIRRGGVSGG
jgi:hypothetical protein